MHDITALANSALTQKRATSLVEAPKGASNSVFSLHCRARIELPVVDREKAEVAELGCEKEGLF